MCENVEPVLVDPIGRGARGGWVAFFTNDCCLHFVIDVPLKILGTRNTLPHGHPREALDLREGTTCAF